MIDSEEDFLILKMSIIVSSGAYIRAIAEKIANDVFYDYGLAFSIKRTKIGIYKKYFSFGFWLKNF